MLLSSVIYICCMVAFQCVLFCCLLYAVTSIILSRFDAKRKFIFPGAFLNRITLQTWKKRFNLIFCCSKKSATVEASKLVKMVLHTIPSLWGYAEIFFYFINRILNARFQYLSNKKDVSVTGKTTKSASAAFCFTQRFRTVAITTVKMTRTRDRHRAYFHWA